MIVASGSRVNAILHAIWKPLALLTGFDILITLAYVGLGWTWLVPRDAPLPLLGTGLVVFLGLRNNTAYARWWEARGLWGAVVNQSRNFARTVCVVFPDAGAGALRDQLIVHQIAWAAALRLSLRGENVREGIAGLLSPEEVIRLEGATNVPFAVQREMARLVTGAAREGRIDSTQFLALNGVMNALTDAQGGLERIRNTPMPQHYALLPSWFVLLYCLLLPFGVVADLGLATPVGAIVLNAMFLTLDRAGANLENPFARSAHDLPMSAISRTIEIDLKETIGHADQPSPLRAVFGVLR